MTYIYDNKNLNNSKLATCYNDPSGNSWLQLTENTQTAGRIAAADTKLRIKSNICNEMLVFKTRGLNCEKSWVLLVKCFEIPSLLE